jgi:hypothetical protein
MNRFLLTLTLLSGHLAYAPYEGLDATSGKAYTNQRSGI